ncbi:MAG: hypothetical protein NVS1B14_02690 [Vulcanimicrobiaceae bacterium]
MLRFLIFVGLLWSLAITGVSAACSGADPAIVSVVVQNRSTDGALNVFHIKGRVVNLGRAKQASNVLQFVGIYETDIRRDVRSVPPLKPGASFAFTYDYPRALTAGSGTTDLIFRLYFRQPNPPGRQDCDLGNDRSALQF